MKRVCYWCGGRAKKKYRLDEDYFCKACWNTPLTDPMPRQIRDTTPADLQDLNVFEEAERVVYGRGEAEYGHPKDNYRRIADLWSPILGRSVTPGEVVLCMAQVKVARLIATPMHRDSVVDLAGYAGVYERVKLDEE